QSKITRSNGPGTTARDSHARASSRKLAVRRPHGLANRPAHGLQADTGPGAMIRNILVALDGSQHADVAFEYALWLGTTLHARLLALHVIDIVSIEGSFLHDVSGSLGFEPYLDFSSKMREALHERGRALLEVAATRCAERSVPCDTALPLGVVANEICDQAR